MEITFDFNMPETYFPIFCLQSAQEQPKIRRGFHYARQILEENLRKQASVIRNDFGANQENSRALNRINAISLRNLVRLCALNRHLKISVGFVAHL